MPAVDETTEAETGETTLAAIAQEPEPIPPMQIPLPGTTLQLSLTVGKERPTSSEIKLRGGSMPIEGQFNDGDEITLQVHVRIAEIAFVRRHDKFGNPGNLIRRHTTQMVGVTRIDENTDL